MSKSIHVAFHIHLHLLFPHRSHSLPYPMPLPRHHPLPFHGWRKSKNFSPIHRKYRTFSRNSSVRMRPTKCRHLKKLNYNLTWCPPQHSILKPTLRFIIHRPIHSRYVMAIAISHHVHPDLSRLVLNPTIPRLRSCKATGGPFRRYKHPIGAFRRQIQRTIKHRISNRPSIAPIPSPRHQRTGTVWCQCLTTNR